MKKLLNVISVAFLSVFFLLCSCKDKEAIREYERAVEKLEQMKKEHRLELNREIALGASEWRLMNIKTDQKFEEKNQAELVYELAKKAGLE